MCRKDADGNTDGINISDQDVFEYESHLGDPGWCQISIQIHLK